VPPATMAEATGSSTGVPLVGDNAGSPSFWPEIFSAVTMVAPSFLLLGLAPKLATAGNGFTLGIWVMTFATYSHCLVSVAFHLECALKAGTKFNQFESIFRVADMCFIHVCCIAYGFALSGGAVAFNFFDALLNLACMASLAWRCSQGLPGRKADSLRVIGCIVVYTSAMAWRGDWVNYLGAITSYGGGAVFWKVNSRMGGWGHGLFHLMLAPCAYCVACSTASA